MIPDQRFLAQCESEALHLSCAIQPHGTLLAAESSGLVCHVAANSETFLGRAPATWLGEPLPPEFAPVIGALGSLPGSRHCAVLALDTTGRRLDVVASRGVSGRLVIELTEQGDDPPAERVPTVLLTERVPDDEAGMQAARAALTERIADLTGFHRVMYYQFRDDGDGEISAEARRGDAYGSYLGLRYPASDIPRIARALYLKNPWRMIPDVAAASVPVIGRTAAAPDLTYSDLRSVSSVHQVYLANMNVGASLSFPVAQGEELTALVAAHHREPRGLPLAVLERGAALVRNHALTLQRYQAQVAMQAIDRLTHRFRSVQHLLATPERLLVNWDQLTPWLLGEFQADGARLCLGATQRQAGRCGDEATLAALEGWFRGVREPTVSHTDSLSRQTDSETGDQVAGVLALRVHAATLGELRLYLTRQESIHEVAWGGNPDKPVEYAAGTNEISPRRSFEKWVEKRKGYCRSWNRMDRLLALNLRQFLDTAFNS